MADELESAFIFDEPEEDEVELGGFNDDTIFENDVKVVEKEEEEEKEEEKVVVKEEEPVVEDENIKELKQQNVDSLMQIDNLNKQLGILHDKFEKDEKVIEDVVLPTDDDWESDPKSATEKLIEARETKLKQEMSRSNDEKFLETKEREVFNTTQTQAWKEAVELAPDLNVEGSDLRKVVENIYDQSGLKNHPMGPLFATCAAMVHTAKLNLGDKSGAIEEGVQIERSRQDRLNRGTMTSDGTDSDSDDIILDSHHIAAAKELGISIESYKKSLNAIK